MPAPWRGAALRHADAVAPPATVTYLILSHQLPDQVVRLAGALRSGSPHAPILIHHDPRSAPPGPRRLQRLGGVELVAPARAVQWGWTSQLDALLACLRHALERVEFDWLAILSGQDYPARPLEAVERELAGSAYDGYVQGDTVSPPALASRTLDEFTARYFYAHRPVRRLGRRLRRILEASRPLVTVRDMPWGTVVGRRVRAPYGPSRPCRRGQDWLTLSRRCVELLDASARTDGALREHYRRVLHPTESFAHTVLHAEQGLRLSPASRRYSAWQPGSPHPAVLGMQDLPAILASGADFARKLDARVDAAVFDALDRAAGVAPRPAL